MYNALKKISKQYMTPQQIYKNSVKIYGVDYEEALEMTYENLQHEASMAIKGIRLPKPINPPQKH